MCSAPLFPSSTLLRLAVAQTHFDATTPPYTRWTQSHIFLYFFTLSCLFRVFPSPLSRLASERASVHVRLNYCTDLSDPRCSASALWASLFPSIWSTFSLVPRTVEMAYTSATSVVDDIVCGWLTRVSFTACVAWVLGGLVTEVCTPR